MQSDKKPFTLKSNGLREKSENNNDLLKLYYALFKLFKSFLFNNNNLNNNKQ